MHLHEATGMVSHMQGPAAGVAEFYAGLDV